MNNKFVFVTPVFNAEETVGKMLASIFHQSYKNWKIILIDDISTDETVETAKSVIYGYAYALRTPNGATTNYWRVIDTGQVEIIKNVEKKWEVENVLKGISMCDDDDIICRIDGDDYLCDLDALNIINRVYNEAKCDALWTNHRWVHGDKVSNVNISGRLTHPDVYQSEWRTSHFKTFRKRLLNDVNDENFRGSDGKYIKRAGDRAIYLPAIRNAKNPVHLPLVTYSYTCSLEPQTFMTDDAKFQKEEADFLHKRGYVK